MEHFQVAVPLAVRTLYDYVVPEEMRSELEPGRRVLVPLGSRHVVGLAVRPTRTPPVENCRPIEGVLDPRPVLSAELLRLAEWIWTYYFALPGLTIRMMLPPGLLSSRFAPDLEPDRFWPAMRRRALVAVAPPSTEESRTDLKGKRLNSRQIEILSKICALDLPFPVAGLLEQGICSPAALETLERRGFVKIEAVEVDRSPWSGTAGGEEGARPHPLTVDQDRVLAEITSELGRPGFRSLLLHGVTASGKTEVYLNAIRHCLAQGGRRWSWFPKSH